jgi:hypothetical protein
MDKISKQIAEGAALGCLIAAALLWIDFAAALLR